VNFRNSDKKLTGVLILAGLLIHFVCVSLRGADASSSRSEVPTNCQCGITNWIVFSPKDHGFSVRFPSQPRILITTNNHTAVGSMVKTQYVVSPAHYIAFSVGCNSFPSNLNLSDRQRFYELTLKDLVAKNLKLLSSTTNSVRGYEGREWKFEMIKEENVIIMRQYLVEHRLYQVHCLMRKDRYCPKHASEFLDSFDL
jgi:hypothetical protein